MIKIKTIRAQKYLKTALVIKKIITEQTQEDRVSFQMVVRKGCYGSVRKETISHLGIPRKAS